MMTLPIFVTHAIIQIVAIESRFGIPSSLICRSPCGEKDAFTQKPASSLNFRMTLHSRHLFDVVSKCRTLATPLH